MKLRSEDWEDRKIILPMIVLEVINSLVFLNSINLLLWLFKVWLIFFTLWRNSLMEKLFIMSMLSYNDILFFIFQFLRKIQNTFFLPWIVFLHLPTKLCTSIWKLKFSNSFFVWRPTQVEEGNVKTLYIPQHWH